MHSSFDCVSLTCRYLRCGLATLFSTLVRNVWLLYAVTLQFGEPKQFSERQRALDYRLLDGRWNYSGSQVRKIFLFFFPFPEFLCELVRSPSLRTVCVHSALAAYLRLLAIALVLLPAGAARPSCRAVRLISAFPLFAARSSRSTTATRAAPLS